MITTNSCCLASCVFVGSERLLMLCHVSHSQPVGRMDRWHLGVKLIVPLILSWATLSEHYRARSSTTSRVAMVLISSIINTSIPEQNGRHFTDDIFLCINLNENVVFWFQFHWSLFLGVQLTIIRLWLKWCKSMMNRFTNAYIEVYQNCAQQSATIVHQWMFRVHANLSVSILVRTGLPYLWRW